MKYLLSFFSKSETLKTTVVIHQIGARYNLDIGDSRIHILNERSLRWNLKNFGVKPIFISEAFECLEEHGDVEFYLEDVA